MAPPGYKLVYTAHELVRYIYLNIIQPNEIGVPKQINYLGGTILYQVDQDLYTPVNIQTRSNNGNPCVSR